MLCQSCKSEISKDDLFCRYCGFKNEPVKEQQIMEPENLKKCIDCGKEFPADRFFCSNCGGRLILKNEETSHVNNQQQGYQVPYNQPIQTSQPYQTAPPNYQSMVPPNIPNGMEQEMYRKNMIGYYKGITQISGTFLITNKKIAYNPSAIYLLSKPFTIDMNEILGAERASVLGINLCIRVTTISGKSHMFALGIQNSKDIQYVVDLINSLRQPQNNR